MCTSDRFNKGKGHFVGMFGTIFEIQEPGMVRNLRPWLKSSLKRAIGLKRTR